MFGHGLASTTFTKAAARQGSSTASLYLRAIQGHIGGHIVVPELMSHVELPHDWKESVLHRGCSFNIKSILETGLIAGGTESKEGRQTIFFTPLNPFGEIQDEEEPGGGLSKTRKVQYYSNWRRPRCCILGKVISSTRSRSTQDRMR